MEFKIIIDKTGTPKLVEVPEKPDYEKCGFENAYYCYRNKRVFCKCEFDYEQALSAALADESKHIPFKDELSVREFIFIGDPLPIGQTFDLPDNIGVSFERRYPDVTLAILTIKENSDYSFTEGADVPEDGTNVIKIMAELNEAIYKFQKNKVLTPGQIDNVIEWMNTWEQLKGTAIPMRFKEDFSTKR